ncbi:MAG TPA: hypothetical protein VHW60_20165 [Caulobacteraceae bacterium]|jgi:hypothetical protein|nr:hypothetical protein [Caulobacteraceae bacterium]
MVKQLLPTVAGIAALSFGGPCLGQEIVGGGEFAAMIQSAIATSSFCTQNAPKFHATCKKIIVDRADDVDQSLWKLEGLLEEKMVQTDTIVQYANGGQQTFDCAVLFKRDASGWWYGYTLGQDKAVCEAAPRG